MVVRMVGLSVSFILIHTQILAYHLRGDKVLNINHLGRCMQTSFVRSGSE